MSSYPYRLLKSTIAFASFGVLIRCLTPIDFPADTGNQRIVITGQVSTLSDRNMVQVGITAKTQRLPFPIEGAAVSLIDQQNNIYYYIESQSTPGEYILSGLTGVPGLTYYLKVELPNGEVYQSLPEQMPLTSCSIFTTHEFVTETVTDNEGVRSDQPLLKIYANSDIPYMEEDVYLKWAVEEVFALVPTDFPDGFGNTPPTCFIYQNADPQRLTLFNGGEVNSSSTTDNLITSRIIDYSFFSRHYFTTYQSSITKEAYEYWHKVNVLANQVGSIFDTPPAEITGNMININKKSEKVLGYFQATNQIYDRFFILPSDLPYPVLWQSCNYFDPSSSNYPIRCLNCLSVRNSSLVRPPWF